MNGIDSATACAWLLSVVCALIGLIWMDMRKQIDSVVGDLKAQVKENSDLLEQNNEATHEVSQNLAIIGENIKGFKREYELNNESVDEKFAQINKFENSANEMIKDLKEKLHELTALFNHVCGLAQLKGWKLDVSTANKNKKALIEESHK
jgi:predicted nuclease with TOPRIM domain